MAAFQFKSLVWIPVSSKVPQTTREVLTVRVDGEGTPWYTLNTYDAEHGKWYGEYLETISSDPTAWADIPSYDLY